MSSKAKKLPAACGLLLSIVFGIGAVVAATPAKPVPPKPAAPRPFVVAAPRYEDAPEPWRSYLLKARAADAIKDPIQRCLAFPPFPGSQWPANLMPAHCEWAFGLGDFNLASVRKLLDAKDLAGLDKFYRDLQARHASETNFSEHIHPALEIFDSSYEAGALSKRWLEAAPDSPFAMVARAEFYRHMGWAARGGAWAQETPDEQFERLGEFHAKAEDLYLKALKIEPQLMPAYAGLVDIAKNGKLIDEDEVFAAAMKVDPACKRLVDERMTALEPRWRGSYEKMVALEQQLLPHLARRPLLSLSRIWPYDDMYNVLYAADKYEEATKVLKPLIAVSSSPQLFDDLAASLAMSKGANRWEELAYLVEPTRFRTGDAWEARERGRLQMLAARDAELANKSLEASVKAEPDNYYGHYLYAASFSRLGKFAEAEREYLIALTDKPETGTHRDALFELADLMAQTHQTAKLRTYAKQAITEYPANARSWVAQARGLAIDGTTDIKPLREALEKIIANGDPTDPRMSIELDNARRTLDQMRELAAKHGEKW